MLGTRKSPPQLLARGDIPQPADALYDLVKLPDDEWQQCGDDLVLPEEIPRSLLRYGLYRLHHRRKDRIHGLLMAIGPPGTGKSDAVRGMASTLMHTLATTGNGLAIRVKSLFSEELGRSAKQVDKLLDAVRLSARKCPTFLIFDDAEGLFLDRRHMLAAKELGDVLRVATTLLSGLDTFKYEPNVIMFATLNIEGAVDDAILSRADHIIHFALPTLEARLTILRNMLTDTAGEEVVEQLAGATEGWSGRDLKKLPLTSFIRGTVLTPDEMTAEDYLRAVGLGPRRSEVSYPIPAIEKENICTSLSPNRFLAAALPRSHK
jgi:SpoVK/Ycf46/Vps4 family AAA+-type ATPase